MAASKKDWDFRHLTSSKQFVKENDRSEIILVHLKEEHHERLREIAQEEFDHLADNYGITYTDKKYSLKDPGAKALLGGKSVFGVKLTTLLNRDKEIDPRCRTPMVFDMLICCMEKHGYRASGVMRLSAKESVFKEVKKLMASDFYGKRQTIEKILMENSVHLTASIIKFFIRSLPGTLFTKKCSDAFLELNKIGRKHDRIKAMKMLIFRLPHVNACVLRNLLLLFKKIAMNQEHNKMSEDALARVVTTCLFEVGKDEMAIGDKLIEDCPPFNLMYTLIHCSDVLFVVPPSMVSALHEKKDDVKPQETTIQKVKGYLKKLHM